MPVVYPLPKQRPRSPQMWLPRCLNLHSLACMYPQKPNKVKMLSAKVLLARTSLHSYSPKNSLETTRRGVLFEKQTKRADFVSPDESNVMRTVSDVRFKYPRPPVIDFQKRMSRPELFKPQLGLSYNAKLTLTKPRNDIGSVKFGPAVRSSFLADRGRVYE